MEYPVQTNTKKNYEYPQQHAGERKYNDCKQDDVVDIRKRSLQCIIIK